MNIDNFEPIPFLKSILIALFSFISPVWGLFLMVGIAVVLDTVYAIYSAVNKDGWGVYKADKLFKLVQKTFFYMGSLLLAFCIDKYVVSNNLIFGLDYLFTKALAVMWVYIEVKSIDDKSVKNGNKSMYSLIKELLKNAKKIKEDIISIKE